METLQLWKKYLKWVLVTIRSKLLLERMPDETFVRVMYKKTTGRTLHLCEPERYSEKLQWLKMFYRDPLMERVSDKYEMKNYLKEIGYGDLAINTIGIYDSVEDIDFDQLPNQFVMKTTNGSSMNLICKDKTAISWKAWKRLFRVWLKQNLYTLGREWSYQNLKPRIIVEQYMEDSSKELRDYKVFCFNGKAEYVEIDENRYSGHKRKYFTADGRLTDMVDDISGSGDLSIEFGELQREIVAIAEELSKPFPWVRIDFYEVGGKKYVGEFTFFDGSGFYNFTPDSWDFTWGGVFSLPEPNYNLSLLEKLKKQSKT